MTSLHFISFREHYSPQSTKKNALCNLFCVSNASELFVGEGSWDGNIAELFHACPTVQISLVNLLSSVLQ